MKPTEISLRYRHYLPIPSYLSPINHLLSSMNLMEKWALLWSPSISPEQIFKM
ncbi:hypothetical protein RHGRI_007639 [Rhododendron griersonianum]|uniref:Uncharacterized protein n=1 Tax=Rhododendron griersonianum TaxID=479676 RepID=A0AAV6KYA2_9ERIC|nr:hypothetical protein RHGRI_007639 [Rhododendron griersonianum]